MNTTNTNLLDILQRQKGGGAVQENVAKIWSKTNLFQILRVYNINERKKMLYYSLQGGGISRKYLPFSR